MKKLLITCLAVMCCTMSFADITKIQGINYILDNANKTATVTSGGDYGEYELNIPPEVTYNDTEYIVTSIGNDAFSGCSSLDYIKIPNTVISIGNQAFYDCSSLRDIMIPYSVKSIGQYVFEGCSNLSSITIPGSVTTIQPYTFTGSSLSSIIIDHDVEKIDERAFFGCSRLTSITIPTSVKSIGDQAFSGCSSLASVSIPEGVESIGKLAFIDCSSLAIVTIPSSVRNIGLRPFSFCTNLTFVVVLATNPPDLECNDFGVNGFPLYVPDVQAYAGWGGFTNIRDVANYKPDALADVYDAMKGETSSAYLNGLVRNNLNAINNSDDYAVIHKNRLEAVGKLKSVVSTYKEIKAAEFGTLGTEQDGPAIEVIGQDDEEVILYNPKKVNFIKVTAEE